MNALLWIIYLSFGVIIITPLIQGDLFRVDKKYYFFKWVSALLLVWWLLDFLRLTVTSGPMIYYITLLVYPTVYLFVAFLYIAMKKHFEHRITKTTYWFVGILFIVNFFLAMTNSKHNLFFEVEDIQNFTFEVSKAFIPNQLFHIHTGIAYIFLVMTIYHILKHIISRLKTNQDVYPFVVMFTAIIIGLSLNIVHVFFYTFTLDPSLLMVAIILSVLYYIFYIRDLKLILGFNRNKFILEHLREKYIIVDESGKVVDASHEFMNQFGITLDETLTYEQLLNRMKKTAVLFRKSDEVIKSYDENKIYLNTVEKSIRLPFYKHSGMFYLFFDQTTNLKYINDMNYVKTHDLMTRIYNRNFLEDMRDSLDDSNSSFEIAMFDLDGLKLFNDYLGHDKGDDLLIRFASKLKSVANDNIYPIRLGGDEFILLSISQKENELEETINYLYNQNKALPFMEQTHFSYALSKRSKNNKTVKTVLGDVDSKLYKMKKQKNNYKELLEIELKKMKE